MTCISGVCALTCEPDQVKCAESCIDPDTDDEYCGARGDCAGEKRGESCAYPLSCVDGACAPTCESNEVACDDTCVDPSSNEDYCGATGSCTGNQAGQSCAEDNQCIRGACRAPDGANCSGNSDCISGKCTTFYQDKDGDGFGAQSSGTAKVCGTSPPSALYVSDNQDCCDVASDLAVAAKVNPDYSGGATSEPAEGCVEPFDWNCDGSLTYAERVGRECASFDRESTCPPSTITDPQPECGSVGDGYACTWSDGKCFIIRDNSSFVECY